MALIINNKEAKITQIHRNLESAIEFFCRVPAHITAARQAGRTAAPLRRRGQSEGPTAAPTLAFSLAEGTTVWVLDNNFPECTIWREGGRLVVQLQEHIYTKYWWHKFHGCVFAAALVRAVKRLQQEGHPLRDPELDSEDDAHLFIRWILEIGANVVPEGVISAIQQSFDLVWRRANSILEDSDSVLILGKDAGEALETLKRIEALLQLRRVALPA